MSGSLDQNNIINGTVIKKFKFQYFCINYDDRLVINYLNNFILPE